MNDEPIRIFPCHGGEFEWEFGEMARWGWGMEDNKYKCKKASSEIILEYVLVFMHDVFHIC